MNVKEVFLIFVAFTLLFLLFCVVTLTGIDSDKSMVKASPHLRGGSQTAGTNKTLIHSSTQNHEKTAHQSKSYRASLSASGRLMNTRPDKPKINAWSLRHRTARSDIKDRLTPIESNGRVYLENMTGVEVCDSNDSDDERAIEVIE